ncbi:hypothetical protein ACFYZE_35125 [Streptomyces sp. NPDC001796]
MDMTTVAAEQTDSGADHHAEDFAGGAARQAVRAACAAERQEEPRTR